MRFVILVPDLVAPGPMRMVYDLSRRHSRAFRLTGAKKLLGDPWLKSSKVHGGTLNNMRHCQVIRSLGVEGVLASPSGRDTYGPTWGVGDIPFIRWEDRKPEDVVLVPDFKTELIDEVVGPAVAYLQVPIHLHRNFDYMSPRVVLWTDSPFMLEKCQAVFPGKDIPIVPNIVDKEAFPFRPQSEREPGVIFAFPRKGADFIEATRKAYEARGGKYWKFELIDGIPIHELARQYARPQAFLASADMEGCALPPQESMAAGVVVIGKKARGANFSMQHGETAMTAEDPEGAAQCLFDLEDDELRDRVSRGGYEFIRRYFVENEPTQFWRDTLRGYGFEVTDPPTASSEG